MLISLKSCKKLIAFTLLNTAFITHSAIGHGTGNDVTSKKLTDNIYLISGRGGNLGVSIGEDGTFLIDDKFANMSDNILAAIKKIGGDTPKFVINTHWHGDHTGGNLALGQQGSIIVAHNNVRKRLSEENFIAAFNRKSLPQPAAALPIITFDSGITFHLNNDDIEVTHLANAHTDGDSVIYFKNNNLLHAGDIFFNGFYPFIDIDHGGSVKGIIAAVDTLLKIINDETIIIPGHGPVANKQDLIRYREMLAQVYQRLSQLKNSGKTVAQAIAAKPLSDLEEKWGNGIFTSEKWINVIYEGLD